MKKRPSKKAATKKKSAPAEQFVSDYIDNPLISHSRTSILKDEGSFVLKAQKKDKLGKGPSSKKNISKKSSPKGAPGKKKSSRQKKVVKKSLPPRVNNGGLANADELLIAFGNRLKAIRKSQRFTLRDLSYRTSLDNSKIAKIEKGLINITLITQHQIFDGLSLTPQEFWSFNLVIGKDS